MLSLPQLPPWDGLHPAISHFPIVLLLLAPAALLFGLVRVERRRGAFEVALALLAAGALGTVIAAATGDAARDSAPRPPKIAAAIAEHEEAGSLLRAASCGTTVLLAGLLYGPRLLRKELSPSTETLLAGALLVLAAALLVPIVDAGHSGGVLVHSLGVHARM